MRFGLVFLVTLATVTMSSCSFVSLLISATDGSGSRLPRFDISGAGAVGVLDPTAKNLLGRAATDDLADFSGFVKLLDSGEVVSAIQFDQGYYNNAKVNFLMKGSDGSVYVGFDQNLYYYSEILQAQTAAQLIRVYPDST